MLANSAKKIHSSIIKSDKNELFNYLIHAESKDKYIMYLHGLKTAQNFSCKAEILEDDLKEISDKCEKSLQWVRDMLLCSEPNVLWSIQKEKDQVKVIWKEKLSNGMKLTLGSVTMGEYDSAPSEMLSVCAASIQRETERANQLEQQAEALEKENGRLREIARQAVEARQQLEDHLVSKCARLLNEKKAKIRAQQELLDERRALEMDRAQHDGGLSPSGGRSPGRSPAAPADRDRDGDRDGDGDGNGNDDPDDPAGGGAGSEDSDAAYEQDTQVDSDATDAEDGGGAAARHDSGELDYGGLEPARPKRPAPEPEPEPAPADPAKRRPLSDDWNDLLDDV